MPGYSNSNPESLFRATVDATKLSAAAAHLDADMKLLYPEELRDYRVFLGAKGGRLLLAALRPDIRESGMDMDMEPSDSGTWVRKWITDPDQKVEVGDGIGFSLSSADITKSLLTWRGGASERSSLIQGPVTLEQVLVDTEFGPHAMLRVRVPGEDDTTEPRMIPLIRSAQAVPNWDRPALKPRRGDAIEGLPFAHPVNDHAGIQLEVSNPTALVLLASDTLRHGQDMKDGILITSDGWMMAKVGGQFAIVAGRPRNEARDAETSLVKSIEGGAIPAMLEEEKARVASFRQYYFDPRTAVVIPKSMALAAGKQGWSNQMTVKSDTASEMRSAETQAFRHLMGGLFDGDATLVGDAERSLVGIIGRKHLVERFQAEAKEAADPLATRCQILIEDLQNDGVARHVVLRDIVATFQNQGEELERKALELREQLAGGGATEANPALVDALQFSEEHSKAAIGEAGDVSEQLTEITSITRGPRRNDPKIRSLETDIASDAQFLAKIAILSASHTRSKTGNLKKPTDSPVFMRLIDLAAHRVGERVVAEKVSQEAGRERGDVVLDLIAEFSPDHERRVPLLKAVVKPAVEKYGALQLNEWRRAFAEKSGGENFVEEQVNLQVQGMSSVTPTEPAQATQFALLFDDDASTEEEQEELSVRDLTNLYMGAEGWRHSFTQEAKANVNKLWLRKVDNHGRVGLTMPGLEMEDTAEISDTRHRQYSAYLRYIHAVATGQTASALGQPLWYADVDPNALEAAAGKVQAVTAHGPHAAIGQPGAVCTAQLVRDEGGSRTANPPGELSVPAKLRLTAFGVNRVPNEHGEYEPATREIEVDAWTHEGAFDSMPVFVAGDPLRRNSEFVNDSTVRVGAHLRSQDAGGQGSLSFVGPRAAFIAPQLDTVNVPRELADYMVATATLARQAQESGKHVEVDLEAVKRHRDRLRAGTSEVRAAPAVTRTIKGAEATNSVSVAKAVARKQQTRPGR